jgi:hypothetical protein
MSFDNSKNGYEGYNAVKTIYIKEYCCFQGQTKPNRPKSAYSGDTEICIVVVFRYWYDHYESMDTIIVQ